MNVSKGWGPRDKPPHYLTLFSQCSTLVLTLRYQCMNSPSERQLATEQGVADNPSRPHVQCRVISGKTKRNIEPFVVTHVVTNNDVSGTGSPKHKKESRWLCSTPCVQHYAFNTMCSIPCVQLLHHFRGYSKDFFQLHKVHSNKIETKFWKIEVQHLYVEWRKHANLFPNRLLSNLSDIYRGFRPEFIVVPHHVNSSAEWRLSWGPNGHFFHPVGYLWRKQATYFRVLIDL